MHNPHPALDPLVAALAISDSRIGCVFAYRFAGFAKTICFNMGNPLIRIIEYCELGYYIIRLRKKDAIIVREFSTYYFLISLFITFLMRKKILLLNAHNIQTATKNIIEKSLINFYLFCGCRLVVLETKENIYSVILPQYISRVMCIKHPVPCFSLASLDKKIDIRIGMVGDFRSEKNMLSVLKNLSRICEHERFYKLEIGSRTFPLRLPPEVKCFVHDTRKTDSYIEFLKNINILVVPYPANSYFFRASGIIAEAISCGAFIITTNLPSLANQVLKPVPVGLVIEENAFVTDDLKRALHEASLNVHLRQDNKRLYCLARSGRSIAVELEEELERNML